MSKWEKGFWLAKITFVPAPINTIGLVAGLISGKIAQSGLFNGRNFSRLIPKLPAGRVDEPFVIGAIIKPGRCLDLTEAHCLGLVSEVYEELRTTMERSGAVLPSNEAGHCGDEDFVRRFLDCAVIEFLHTLQADEHRPPFDTVRGAFFEGGELYPGARISARTHIQWCVRDPLKSIVGYFRVTTMAQE